MFNSALKLIISQHVPMTKRFVDRFDAFFSHDYSFCWAALSWSTSFAAATAAAVDDPNRRVLPNASTTGLPLMDAKKGFLKFDLSS
jgi:hypothetical protein